MKAIFKTYRPEWLVNILNGNADILVAKYFPKDYVGWVYIYCTKGKPNLYCDAIANGFVLEDTPRSVPNYLCNGKVVARFWYDKVEEITQVWLDGLRLYYKGGYKKT